MAKVTTTITEMSGAGLGQKRKDLGLSIEELADITKLSVETIQKCENMDHSTSLDTMVNIDLALGKIEKARKI